MRTLPIFLLAALLLAACQLADEPGDDLADQDADVEVPPPSEVVDEADELVGSWVLTEQAGAAPDDVYTATFTTTGEYIILREGFNEERMEFVPAGENMISVVDSLDNEVERYTYDVSGNTLTLTDATGVEATLERRDDLLDERDELTPDAPADPPPAPDQPPTGQEQPADG